MSKHLVYDIETLSLRENAVILSIGIVPVDFSKDFDYQDLIDNAFFVKLDARDQIERLGREKDEDTVNWWRQQDKETIRSQVKPQEDDVPLEAALNMAGEYMLTVEGYNRKSSWVWTRGAMDAMVTEHACHQVGRAPLFPFWVVRDVRTAVDIIAGTDRGYCKVDAAMPDVQKHHPVHDCAYDAMMIKYPVIEN